MNRYFLSKSLPKSHPLPGVALRTGPLRKLGRGDAKPVLRACFCCLNKDIKVQLDVIGHIENASAETCS